MTTVEEANIRGLDVDKAIKGFALTNYIFKGLVSVSSMSGDSIRWYQETAADLTATSPSKIADIAPLATFTNLEPTWTRNTSYPRKYGARGFISMEDIKSADIDVLARTLLRLTRAVVKQVDTRIYNVMSESQSPSDIGTAAATGTGWDDTTNGNPVLDIMAAQQNIAENDYSLSGFVVAMDPKNHKDLMNYLITVKGSSIPQFSSDQIKNGVVMEILSSKIVVSNNVVADSVWCGIPNVACTWKTYAGTTGQVVDKPGLGKEILVWELGEAILTDPKAAYLITDTNT